MTRLLLTGVRGKTGVPLATGLAARPDVDVLGGSSDPGAVRLEGVRPVPFSWDERGGWADALSGVDAVYVVRPDREDAPGLVEALVAATPPRTRIVLLSERNAGDLDPGGWATRVEDAVRRGGRPWTILRPGWFMQVLVDPRFYLDEIRAGGLSFPSGGSALAWIDARDIAAVAERALLEPGHDGAIHELTGPEAVSLPRTVALLADALGRPVEHREPTVDEAVADRSGFARELDVLTFARVHHGSFTEVTDTVERVTGRPPRTLPTFLADHVAVLRDGS